MSAATTTLDLEQWLDALESAGRELARAQLGYESFTVVGRRGELPARGHVGSYVALVGEEGCAQIGLVAPLEQCRALTRRMLALQEPEKVSARDVCDAVGELANILGGSVKRRVGHCGAPYQLGLPLFTRGAVEASDSQEIGVVAVELGPVAANLVVVRRR